jgi:tetrapyrrole methylase family protein / MazG family protein
MDDLKARLDDPALTPFERLVLVLRILRSEQGCAWDRKQTHKSLQPYLIEEAYEVIEAIENEDFEDLKEELGDLLCQIAFHGQLASERGHFATEDAVNHIVGKLIKRHPHVFGERRDLDPDQVRDQWEQIKIGSGEKKSVLGGLPGSMPALMMAFRVGEKAAGVGFDWHHAPEVLEKVSEEISEIRAEMGRGDKGALEDEIGDLLFATASLARKLDIDPERALKRALEKFRARFALLEDEVRQSQRPFGAYTLDELEAIWQRVK